MSSSISFHKLICTYCFYQCCQASRLPNCNNNFILAFCCQPLRPIYIPLIATALCLSPRTFRFTWFMSSVVFELRNGGNIVSLDTKPAPNFYDISRAPSLISILDAPTNQGSQRLFSFCKVVHIVHMSYTHFSSHSLMHI